MTPTIVELCRALLERAERGDYTGIAIATCNADLCTGNAWSMDEATLAELLGSVAMLNARLLQQAADPFEPA